jgi:hypothetical protein
MREPEPPPPKPIGIPLPDLTFDEFMDLEDGRLNQAERV